MDTLKIPLLFSEGSAAVWTDGTDEYYAHLLFCFTSTQRGELPLRPAIGIDDIVFDTNSIQTLAYNVAQYVPEVDIAELTALPADGGKTQIKLSFVRKD